MDYDNALKRLTDWAMRTDSVRALILTGSAAAGTTHPLSDRDIEVYATDPTAILADESWWADLGEVLVVERLENPGWHPTRLVYYAGGKLDLTVIDATVSGTIRHERPFRVLLDKDGLAAGAHESPISAANPDAETFDEQVNWAYAAALMCAKAIVRDDPWSSKVRDGDLKRSLRTMIEWDHRARCGTDYDVRFLGSRMRQWMDPDIQAELELCWGRFDANDSAASLRATVALFGRLATRTTAALDLPPFDHERLRVEIETLVISHG